jgi:hypothetical protein
VIRGELRFKAERDFEDSGDSPVSFSSAEAAVTSDVTPVTPFAAPLKITVIPLAR